MMTPQAASRSRTGTNQSHFPPSPLRGQAPERLADLRLLDEHGQLQDEVQDVCRERLASHKALEQHWTWGRVRAEQEERCLYGELRHLPQDLYERARALLATTAAGERRALRRQWHGLWGRLDFFEPVSTWPWCQLRGWWFACPVCTWPMRVTIVDGQAEVRCESHMRRAGCATRARPRAAGRRS
ncbi:hypothetical protein ACFRAO_34250 [Streptomyces sp. NPDC056656]|uniref:hypothetical protein n=1 Tax=Streptomyces sp. NPDC056656 TaxID=3345895 RepID=UPI0036AF10D3